MHDQRLLKLNGYGDGIKSKAIVDPLVFTLTVELVSVHQAPFDYDSSLND